MKTMILVPSFGKSSPIRGAFLFAKYLHDRGLDVLFVSLDDDYNSKENIIDEVVRANIEFKCLHIRGWRGLFLRRSRIRRYVAEKDVDLVLSYMLRPTLLTVSLPNVVRFASVRGMLRDDYALSYGYFASSPFVFWEMKALQNMDHVFAMTKPMLEWLVSEGIEPNKVSVVNNFIDVRSINSYVLSDVSDNRNWTDIGMFCSFIPRKRIDVAIRAMSILAHDFQRRNVRLHLAGDGPLLSDMKKLSCDLDLKNNVIFHGFLSEPLDLMPKMNLVLLTSESEGVPRCLMEALSLGKTVVASDIPGVNELVRDGQTGYLFPVGDDRQLASLIDRVIGSGLFISSRRLVSYMLENYDLNAACERMLRQMDREFDEQKAVH